MTELLYRPESEEELYALMVYRCLLDNTVHDVTAYPDGWELIS